LLSGGFLDILFANDDLRALCHDDRRAKKELGAVGAKKLRARLDDLAATTCLEEMRTLPGRCHELKRDRAGELALDLDGGCRLVFRPCEPVPRKADGGLDWTNVTSIEITDIGDYH
jgi:proteic killer suppression protein